MSVTGHYLFLTAWALISPFQYGYHTGALNQIQGALSCQTPSGDLLASAAPSSCVEMSDAVFGAVTSAFTIGGFVGSSSASLLLDKYGRRGVLLLNSLGIALGSAVFSASSSIAGLVLGRLIIGLGCGLGLCALPLYLAETAPPRLKDKVGVLNQLSITIGILITQCIGLPLAKRSQWRPVLVISSILAVAHLASGLLISDTPAWLAAKGRHSEAEAVSRKIHGIGYAAAKADAEAAGAGASPSAIPDDTDGIDVRTALLADPEEPERHTSSSLVPPTESVGVLALLKAPDLRRAVFITSVAMIAQQGSGINAVIYYSTDILRQALSADAAFISILIGVVNVVMTFAPILLINKFGTRKLIIASIAGSFVSVTLLGYGLDTGTIWLSSITILLFVAFFALGLGPVPFMLTAELVPYYATSSLSSFALSLNWTSNFIVGISFLPLRNFLASLGQSRTPGDGEDPPDGEGGKGRVFYVFASILAVVGVSLVRLYRRR